MRDLLDHAFARGWLTILAMAIVTMGLRVAGFWAMGRIALTPRVRRGLEALPVSLLVATSLPIALQAGVVGIACAAAVAGTMLMLRSETAAVVVGLATAALLRAGGL